MFSAYLCRCGCEENVAAPGEFVRGHEHYDVSENFKKFKKQKLKEVEDAKKAARYVAPNFGRGANQPAPQPGTHVPAKAPVIGGRKG